MLICGVVCVSGSVQPFKSHAEASTVQSAAAAAAATTSSAAVTIAAAVVTATAVSCAAAAATAAAAAVPSLAAMAAAAEEAALSAAASKRRRRPRRHQPPPRQISLMSYCSTIFSIAPSQTAHRQFVKQTPDRFQDDAPNVYRTFINTAPSDTHRHPKKTLEPTRERLVRGRGILS